MTGFTVELKFDDAALRSVCDTAFYAAAELLGDRIRDDCRCYVPYDTGALCRSVHRSAVTQEGGRVGCDVVWSAPYASAVYYGDSRGVRFRTEHHTHAQARWFEGARASCGDAWAEAVRDAVQHGVGV